MAGRNGPCGEFSWPLPTSPGPDVVRHSRYTLACTTRLARYAERISGVTGEMGYAVGAARTPRDKVGGEGLLVVQVGLGQLGQPWGVRVGHAGVLSEMRGEERGEGRDGRAVVERGVLVVGTVQEHGPSLAAGRTHRCREPFALLGRGNGVRCPVQEQHWGAVGVDVGDRAQ